MRPAFTGTRLGALLKILPKNPRGSWGATSASVPLAGSSSSSSSTSSSRLLAETGARNRGAPAETSATMRFDSAIWAATASSDVMRPLPSTTSTSMAAVLVVTSDLVFFSSVWWIEALARALGVGVDAAGDATRARLLRGDLAATGDYKFERVG